MKESLFPNLVCTYNVTLDQRVVQCLIVNVFLRVDPDRFFFFHSHHVQILHDYSNRLENIRSQFPAHSSSTSPDSGSTSTLVQDNASAVFELNIALQDLQKFV